MYVRRIPLDSVPEDEQEASDWLHKLFCEKDKIIDSFHNTGSFFATSGFKEIPSRRYPRRLSTIINFAAWSIFSISLVIYFLITSLQSGNWIAFSIAVGIFLTCKYNLIFYFLVTLYCTLFLIFFYIYIQFTYLWWKQLICRKLAKLPVTVWKNRLRLINEQIDNLNCNWTFILNK